MLVCNATCCPTDSKPPVPHKICKKVKKKYNYTHIVAFDCGYQFTDIKDVAEWQAALTAGDIQCFPKGLININPPTETVIDVDNDGGKDTVDGEVVVDYSLYYHSDDEDNLEETFFHGLKQKSGRMGIAFLDADGYFTISQSYIDALAAAQPNVVGESPGFRNSVTQTPHTTNENGYRVWRTQFTLQEDQVLRSVKLAGVPAVLCC